MPDSDTKHAGRARQANGFDAMSGACAECGDPIPSDEWHPVATRRDEDGEIEIFDFCGESCRSAWRTDVGADD
jgi:hypothetical protein